MINNAKYTLPLDDNINIIKLNRYKNLSNKLFFDGNE